MAGRNEQTELVLGARELTPDEQRSLWRGHWDGTTLDVPSPKAQRAAWRIRWKTPFLVEPARGTAVIDSHRLWWTAGGRLLLVRFAVVAGAIVIASTVLPGGLVPVVGALLVAGAALAHLPRRLALRGRRVLDAWRLDRARAHPASAPRQLPPGAWTGVRGQVLEGPTFQSASGRRCVLAYYVGNRTGTVARMNEGALEAQAEVHAIDFHIVLPSREVVHVLCDRARFVPRPLAVDMALFSREPLALRPITTRAGAPAFSRVMHEEIIAPGDHIEVLGLFQRAPERAGSAGSRTPTVETVVRSDGQRHLLLRALD